MTKKEITIQLASGLEARPVAMLVQVASQFESEIHVECKGGKSVNAKSIMGMMTLGLATGETVVVSANGADEAEAVKKIETYLSASN
ncbi:MAG: HPr family phosphocarrier protein [Lachnospiraceae bacterium]|nr:HPr family phosphocarrier protein [Lachnospiraceae bacterium]